MHHKQSHLVSLFLKGRRQTSLQQVSAKLTGCIPHQMGLTGQIVNYSFKTHRSRARVRDFVLIGCPVVLRSLSVGKWAIKGSSNILHAIDTYCIAFKHSTEKKVWLVFSWITKLWLYNTNVILHWPCCTKKAEDFWVFIILVLEKKHILWNTKGRTELLFVISHNKFTVSILKGALCKFIVRAIRETSLAAIMAMAVLARLPFYCFLMFFIYFLFIFVFKNYFKAIAGFRIIPHMLENLFYATGGSFSSRWLSIVVEFIFRTALDKFLGILKITVYF